MAQRKLEAIAAADCYTLVGQQRVGRLVYQDGLGPVAVPVNYALDGHDVIIRVEGGAKQAAMAQPRIAFEVDHIDEAHQSGWSVIIRGVGSEIPLADVPALLHRTAGEFPAPWAAGVHNTWLRISPDQVTGRRFEKRQTTLAV